MPVVRVNGVGLYYESTGEGTPLVFVHEFAGNCKSWEAQVRFFCRRYRAVTYNARGYPPSDVPGDPGAYSQDIHTEDLAGLLRALGLAPAHVVGLSMGGYATLHLGLRHPGLARSLVVGGCGYGSVAEQRARFQSDAREVARRFEEEGMEKFGRLYAAGPTRFQLQNKDPRGYAEYVETFLKNSPKGLALTMGGVQAARPSVYELAEGMRKMEVPTLILAGDEDDPCLEPALFMKRTIPTAGLLLLPNSGHLINLEEPALFNEIVLGFITQVDSGRWPRRDPRTLSPSALFRRQG